MSNRLPRYRIWDAENKEYLDSAWGPHSLSLVDWDASDQATDDGNGSVSVELIGLRGLLFEQHTGLEDRLGRQIYEGDILEWRLDRSEWSDKETIYRQLVQWTKHSTGSQGHGERLETIHIGFKFDAVYGPPETGTIVGNRNENPELIP